MQPRELVRRNTLLTSELQWDTNSLQQGKIILIESQRKDIMLLRLFGRLTWTNQEMARPKTDANALFSPIESSSTTFGLRLTAIMGVTVQRAQNKS